MYNIYITQTNFQQKKFGISVKSFSNSLSRQAVGADGFASLYYAKDYPKGYKGVVVIARALAELGDFGKEELHSATDLVANESKSAEDFFFRACRLGRVFEADVQSVGYSAVKCRAGLVGIATDCYDIVPVGGEVVGDIGGGVGGYVDADFVHHYDGVRVDLLCRKCAG